MGTRGAYGFYKKGVNKIAYNHYDSYPDGLGIQIVEFINKTSVEKMNEIFDRIILVNEDDQASEEQAKECAKYLNLEVGNKSDRSWYCLLRGTQGDLSCYEKDI